MANSLLLTNIRTLYQAGRNPDKPLRGEEMSFLPDMANAFLRIEHGRIHSFGPMAPDIGRADHTIDCSGKLVLPSWCDSHSHIVYAESRELEFEDRIRGMTYEEIADRGGGILNSAAKLRDLPEEVLLERSYRRLEEVIRKGTGALEIKSGYGLAPNAELKMLRVIRKMKEISPIPIRATFLGAHAYPMAYRQDHEGYMRQLLEDMLPRIADEGLADYIDAFCESGFFSVEETARIVEAGNRYGLKAKLHVNQLTNSGGVQLAVEKGALSADHLECVGEEEIDLLAQSDTIATALPSCSFFLNIPYSPGRKLIDAGAAFALASDYNPGSTPSGNMPFVLSLACIKMRLTPEEAVNAATINGAFAMGVEEQCGTIAAGKRANLIITKPVPSLAFIPYAFGSDHIEKVVLSGEVREI